VRRKCTSNSIYVAVRTFLVRRCSFLVRRCITNLSKEHIQHPSFVVDEEESKLIIIMAQNGDNTDADEYLPDYKDQARLHPRDVITERRANHHDTTPDVNLNVRHRDQPRKQPLLSSSLPPLAKNAVVAAVVTTATTMSAPIGANHHHHHPTLPIADALPIVFVYGSTESNASGPTSTGASPNSSSTNLLHHQNDDAGSSGSSSNSSRSRSPKMNESSILFQVSRTTCRWSLVIILMVIVVSVIGGLCGTGKCSSSSSNNNSNSGHNDSTGVNTTVPQNTTTTPSNVAAYLRSISLITANTDTDDSKNHEYLVMAENMTIDWLTKKDPLVLSLDDPADLFRLRQRFALVNLWFGTTVQNETFNMLWDEYHGWCVALEECAWYGVTCTIHDFINDDDPTKSSWGNQSVVEEISLRSNSLQGRLSPNLGLFERLQRIDFSENRLIGSIPSSLSCNTFLSSVIVHMNTLTGTIPEEFGSLTNMRIFSIYDNMLSGTIPDSLGQWTNLSSLNIENSGVTGTLPESMSQWTNLKFLHAANNALYGTLPEWIGQQWMSMEKFEISSNMFNETIPSSVGLWSNLTMFSIKGNSFTGTIPETIGNWSMIETAYFNGNALTGSVPEAICNATKLTTLVTNTVDVSCACCTNNGNTEVSINETTPSPPL
jgi:hypothetical protein